MSIKIDDADVQTVKIIREEISKLSEKLGLLEFNYTNIKNDFETEKNSLISKLKNEQERFNGFINSLGKKFGLDKNKQWIFNEDLGKFETKEGE